MNGFLSKDMNLLSITITSYQHELSRLWMLFLECLISGCIFMYHTWIFYGCMKKSMLSYSRIVPQLVLKEICMHTASLCGHQISSNRTANIFLKMMCNLRVLELSLATHAFSTLSPGGSYVRVAALPHLLLCWFSLGLIFWFGFYAFFLSGVNCLYQGWGT